MLAMTECGKIPKIESVDPFHRFGLFYITLVENCFDISDYPYQSSVREYRVVFTVRFPLGALAESHSILLVVDFHFVLLQAVVSTMLMFFTLLDHVIAGLITGATKG